MLRVNPRRWSHRARLAWVISLLLLFPAQATSSSAAGPARVTLRFSFTNTAFEILNNTALIRAFHKLHPEITIQPEPIAGSAYAQKLALEASAGTLPDIIWTIDALVVPFAQRHILLDMQPLVDADSGFNVKDIYPVALNLGRVPGQKGLFMLPREIGTITLFYNRTMFKAAGVPYPTRNWSYADFLAAARKLTKKDASGKTVQWGLDLSDYGWWPVTVPWMVGFGGSMVTSDGQRASFSAPGSVKGIQAIADLFLKDKVVAPPAPIGPFDPFVLGKAAMFPSVRAYVPGFRAAIGKKFDWDAQIMPAFPSGRRVVGMGAAGYSVSATTRNRAAAWSFVRFVTGVEGQRLYAHSYAAVPARASLANDPSWRSLAGPPYDNAAFVDGIKYGILPPSFPLQASLACGTVYSGEAATAIGTALTSIIRGAPVAPTLTQLDSQINGCLAQAQ